MNDETRTHAYALLTNSANTADTDPSTAFTRTMSTLTQTTLREARLTGDPGTDESQILACAVILDELAARITSETTRTGPSLLPRSSEDGESAADTARDAVLDELRTRVPRDGTAQADLATALIDFTIHRRDADREDDAEYRSVVARLYRIHERVHTGTAAECYVTLLAASATVINDLITQLVTLTDTPAAEIRHSMREFIRSQPSPTRV